MSNFDKHVLAFFPPIYSSDQFKDYRVLEKQSISDTLLDENDESLVFVTIAIVERMFVWRHRSSGLIRISKFL